LHWYVRLGEELVEETAAVLFCEDACETPRLFLKWLDVLDLYHKHIARLGCLDVERTCEIVYPGEIYVSDIVCGIIVLDLAASPVYTFDLHDFPVLDRGCRGDWHAVRDTGLV
jgi:hypothetical protein